MSFPIQTPRAFIKSETGGPDVAVIRVKDLEETAELLNLVPSGLVGSLYSGNRENYARLADDVDVGIFHWNRPTIAPLYRLPVSGAKKSGNARPMGSYAWLECTQPVSSLEYSGTYDEKKVPAAAPKFEEKR